MGRMVRLTACLASCVLLAAGAAAQDEPADVAELFRKLQEVRAKATKTREEASAELRKADEGDEEARRKYSAALTRASQEILPVRDRFLAAFLASDWAAWDAREHAALLEEGLSGAGRQLLSTDPARARVAFELLCEKLPDSQSAKHARTRYLPQTFLAAGDLDALLGDLKELGAQVPEAERPGLAVFEGDGFAMHGELETAREVYQRVLDSIPEQLPAGDPRADVRERLQLRLRLVGQPAPDVDSGTWLGGEARSLASLKGSVVVLDFWATWCAPCRAVMPELNRMAAELAPSGVHVLGVTRFYDRGFMVDGPDMKSGTAVTGMTADTFLDHLAQFRAASGALYPFVVGTEQDFRNYHVAGIPTVVLVDKEGSIRLVLVGGGKGAVLERAVTLCQ